MTSNDTTQNVQNQNMDNEELYRIECYVETVSSASDGNVTVRGVDGYRLEKKEGEKARTYNVFWKVENAKNDEADEALIKAFPAEKRLSLDENGKVLQFLLPAKANHLKASLDVALDKADGKDKVLIQKISLI